MATKKSVKPAIRRVKRASGTGAKKFSELRCPGTCETLVIKMNAVDRGYQLTYVISK